MLFQNSSLSYRGCCFDGKIQPSSINTAWLPISAEMLKLENDLRDGVTYTVLMRQLCPEVWPGDELDSEIDPQARIDAVMEMASKSTQGQQDLSRAATYWDLI